MPRITIDTDQVPSVERPSYWHEHFAPLWGCVSMQAVENFAASMDSIQLGPLRLNRITASGLKFSRSALPGASFFSLAFPVSGCARVVVDGRAAHLSPGNAYLLDNRGHGEFVASPSYTTCNVQIPATLLDPRFLQSSSILQVPLTAAAGGPAMVRDYVKSLRANAEQISESHAALFARQLCELVAFMVDGCEGLQSEDSSVVSAHRRRVLAYIAAHYGDCDLSPESIASACGLSRSYLHRIFKGSNQSIMQRVRRVRLERARDLLQDPLSRDQSVTEVCYRVGFSSAAEFSRAFKQAFGVAPKQLRNEARARTSQRESAASSRARVSPPISAQTTSRVVRPYST